MPFEGSNGYFLCFKGYGVPFDILLELIWIRIIYPIWRSRVFICDNENQDRNYNENGTEMAFSDPRTYQKCPN